MYEQVAKGIYAKFTGNEALSASLTGGLWFQRARQNPETPYAVYVLSGSNRDEIMGTADDAIINVDVQFNVFSDAVNGGKEIVDLLNDLAGCYDWQTLTIDGYQHIKMQPVNRLPMGYVDEIWQGVANYELSIIKT
jgi:hypothetical protein